jgi:hypothetical protein
MLRHLCLDFSQVTDKCIEDLKELKGLVLLDLNFTKMTQEGAKKLRLLLPNCDILHTDDD